MTDEANLQNEEARIRVDALNTEAHNLQLKETLARSEDELNNRDRLIEKYQAEIRQRGDEIEKKARKRLVLGLGWVGLDWVGLRWVGWGCVVPPYTSERVRLFISRLGYCKVPCS